MSIVEELMNINVIIQGALGSFLFWIAFEIIKRLMNVFSTLFGKYNRALRKENLLIELAQSNGEIAPIDSILSLQARAICNHIAINRGLKGIIYLVLGLISSTFIDALSVIAYGYSLYYFFRAHKSAYLEVEVNKGKDREWHIKRIEYLKGEIAKINQKNA